MAKMIWEDQVPKAKKQLLAAAKRELQAAWRRDKKYPKSYPLNTAGALAFIQEEMRTGKPLRFRRLGKVSKPKGKPKRFSDLVPDRNIKRAYEDQHAETYSEALAEAWEAPRTENYRAIAQLVRAVEQAYWVSRWGMEIPKPKVNVLHRRVLKIAALAGIGDASHRVLAEFLDYLCPCPASHNWDAVRKLRKRKF